MNLAENPHDPKLERLILGALMLEDSYYRVSSILSTEAFYDGRHQKIWEAIKARAEKGLKVDIMLVTEEMKKQDTLDDIGGPFFLVSITDEVASTAHIEDHAHVLSKLHQRRQLMDTALKMYKAASDRTKDVDETLQNSQKSLTGINKQGAKMQKLSQVMADALKSMEATKEGLSGVPSGFQSIDEVTGGWQPTDLIILAARPGMGKTALALAFAKNASLTGPAAIFSLEMGSVQLGKRLISQDAEITSKAIRDAKLEQYEWQQLTTSSEMLAELPIFIDDTPGISLMDLRSSATMLRMKYPDLQLIVIDYIQLMRGDRSGNREQEISSISRGLKGLAKELNVPIIALSQLSRAVETRGGDKRPMLSDLRESGAIEQDADMVAFLYRPKYYHIDEDEDGNSTEGMAEFIIQKHRSGDLKTIKLHFTGKYTKFAELSDEDFKESQITPNNGHVPF